MTEDILMSTVVKTNRLRRTNDQLAALDEQLIDVLEECQPQSVRHVYYRMTDTRLAVSVPKTDKGPGNGYGAVQRRLSKLREDGRIPYSWIVDFTRRGYHVITYRGASEFIRRTAALYRANVWEAADGYVEVWVESRLEASKNWRGSHFSQDRGDRRSGSRIRSVNQASKAGRAPVQGNNVDGRGRGVTRPDPT